MSMLKNARGFLYGIAIAIAVSATAATVYNYFPPPGITYSPTAGIVFGSATGGSQGAGSVNAQSMFVNGAAVVTGAGLPVGANPTGTVGLTAVNGSATTFLRSDGAPPLSQSIAPTWTGVHTFANAVQTVFNNASAALNAKNSIVRMNSSGQFVIQSATDAAPTTPVTNSFEADRTGSAWSALSFGNATDNPTFSFLGTGAFSVAGGVTVGSPTGGNQGAGTINMQGCFVNGVACSTGGASGANPTGTVGLTAVNGSAGTYMRSDAAPPLSQAISPIWTGMHMFNGANTTSVATSGVNLGQTTNRAIITMIDTNGAADSKMWQLLTGSSGTNLSFRAINDAQNTTSTFLSVTRSGVQVTNIAFGSADNPTYTFSGTGTASFNGSVSVASTSGVSITQTAANMGSNLTLNGGPTGSTINRVRYTSNTGANNSFSLRDDTAGVDRISINSSGGVTFTAPSTGTAFTVNQVSGSPGVVISSNGTSDALDLNGNGATQQAQLGLQINGTAKGFFGVAGTTNNIITGSVAGDIALRTQGGSLLVSTNSGSSAALTLLTSGGMLLGAPTGGDQGAGTLNVAGNLFVNGVAVGSTVTGTFTATMSLGCTTTPTSTVTYSIVGKIVTLWFAPFTCTSNSAGFTMTGLPVSLQPASTHVVGVEEVEDNTVSALHGTLQVGVGGSMFFGVSKISGSYLTDGQSSWTASGTKGINTGFTAVYTLQ